MKHIISWVLRLPSREGVRLTIAPSRPAPPHFEPPPSWGRVRGVGPEAQRGMLAAYLPAIPLQGLIDFQPTRCQALFSSLCCTAWGWRVCLGWGEMKLIRSCVYVAIFIVRAKCCMDLIFCGFHLQHIFHLQSGKKLFVTSFICSMRETEAWRGLPHCDHMLDYWVTYTLKRY